MVDDCGNIAGKVKITFVTDTENKRASAAGTNQNIRFFFADYAKAERTFDLLERLENCALQIAIVKAGNQVSHNFGVRFGLEFYAFTNEFGLETCVVFDDAIVDN